MQRIRESINYEHTTKKFNITSEEKRIIAGYQKLLKHTQTLTYLYHTK